MQNTIYFISTRYLWQRWS